MRQNSNTRERQEQTNTICRHEEIKGKLNKTITLYHSGQNILSSRLLFKNLKFKTQTCEFTCLYGCDTTRLFVTL